MKPRRFLLFILIVSTLLNGQNKPQIFHQIPEKFYYGQFDWLRCVVDHGDYHLVKVSIFIKDQTRDFFTEYPLSNDNGLYVLQLIPEMLQTEYLIYFITAEFSDFALLAFPPENPKEYPVVVPIFQEKRAAKTISTREVAKIFCDLGQKIDNVQSVTIYIRYGQSGQFIPEPMAYQKGRFQYSVQKSPGKDEKLYFYIAIVFTDQTTLSYPSEEFEKYADYRILMGKRK